MTAVFVFPNEESWLTALDVLRRRFGPEYFEAVDSGSTTTWKSSHRPCTP